MTNEEIFNGNSGRVEDVGYWTHRQMKIILRLMALARADELRSMAARLEEMSAKPVPEVREFDCDLMRITADRLEREARA